MAKLQVYKFVNPGMTQSKSALVSPLKQSVLAVNRIGSTVSSAAGLVTNIHKIALATEKAEEVDEMRQRREAQRKRDQAAEEEREVGGIEKGLKKKKNRKKVPGLLRSKAKGLLGIVENFLGPVGSFLMNIGAVVIATNLMKWLSDEENIEKLTVFLEKAAFVFDKLFGFASWLTDGFLSAFDNLFGEDSTFGERLKGLGTFFLGFIALKALMNPFGLIQDIIGLADQLFGGKPKKPPGSFDTPDGRKPKPNIPTPEGVKKPLKPKKSNFFTRFGEGLRNFFQPNRLRDISDARNATRLTRVAEVVGDGSDKVKAATKANSIYKKSGDAAAEIFTNALEQGKSVARAEADVNKALKQGKIKPNPPPPSKPGFFQNIFSGVQDLGKSALEGFKFLMDGAPKWASAGWNTLSEGAKASYNAVKSGAESAYKFTTEGLNNLSNQAKQYFFETVLTPLKPTLDKLSKPFTSAGDALMGALKKMPGFNQVTKLLTEKGISISNIGAAGSKLGKRAATILPVIGGIVNLLFAYERFASGDTIGGLIEGISGILDLSGVGFVPSLFLDGYMFARDFLPGIQATEEGIVSGLGLSGLKSNLDNLFSKLPNLGEIVNTLTGGGDSTKVGTVQGQGTQELFIGGIVKGIGKAVSGAVKGVSKVVSGVGNAISGVINSPVGQIVSTAASLIPGVGPVIAGVKGIAALAQGNPMAALGSAIGMIPGASDMIGNFMGSQAGGILTDVLSGNFAGAALGGLNMLSPSLGGAVTNFLNSDLGMNVGNIFGSVMSGDFTGAISQGLSMIPGVGQGLSSIFGDIAGGNLGSALSKGVSMIPGMSGVGQTLGAVLSGGLDPMTMVGSVADHFGLGGVFDAFTAAGQGDYKQAMITVATDFGVDPKALGIMKKGYDSAERMMSKGGFSAEYAMQEALEFIPVPVVIDKILPMPTPVPINTPSQTKVIPMSSPMSQRVN